jgi:CRP/FNR family transcriptional regulator, cyclic AMP receptor protein
LDRLVHSGPRAGPRGAFDAPVDGGAAARQHSNRPTEERARMTLTRDRRTELVAGCPLFRGVPPDQLAAVAETATEVDFPAGRVIARQGEIGTGFFIVVEGGARVIRDGTTLARLGPGEFFGELSVLDGLPRIAQVVADAPTRCLAIASWDLERVLLDHPALTLGILRELAGRLRSVTEQQHHH